MKKNIIGFLALLSIMGSPHIGAIDSKEEISQKKHLIPLETIESKEEKNHLIPLETIESKEEKNDLIPLETIESKEEISQKKHLIPLENLNSKQKRFFIEMSEKFKNFDQVTSDYIDETKEEEALLLKRIQKDCEALKVIKRKALYNFNIMTPDKINHGRNFADFIEVWRVFLDIERNIDTLIKTNTVGKDTYLEPSTLKSLEDQVQAIVEEYSILTTLHAEKIVVGDIILDDGLKFYKNFEEHFKKLKNLVRQTGDIMAFIAELSEKK